MVGTVIVVLRFIFIAFNYVISRAMLVVSQGDIVNRSLLVPLCLVLVWDLLFNYCFFV